MKRLGDILIDSGFLSQAELQEALEAQRNDSTKKRLGEIIVEKGLLTELDILRAISSQYDLPIIDLQQVDIDQEATKVVTEQYCEENLIIPVAFDEGKLVVAIYDPLNILVTDNFTKTFFLGISTLCFQRLLKLCLRQESTVDKNIT